MKPYVLHPQAKADLFGAAEYYERQSWDLAGRFTDETERLVMRFAPSLGYSVFFVSILGGILADVFRMR